MRPIGIGLAALALIALSMFAFAPAAGGAAQVDGKAIFVAK